MKGIENQTAVVTGGAAGIGAACVHKLLGEGANVVIVDWDAESITRFRSNFTYSPDRLMILQLDIGEEDGRHAAIEHAIEWKGTFDILINNAATFVMKGVEATSSDWQQSFDINVVACARLTHLMASKACFCGSNRAVVNICSISATHAQPHFATYNASKGALLTLTKCMALDLAAQGIRVNCVSPGTIWTESNAGHILRRYGVDRAGADLHPELGGKHVLRRLGDPSEVANAVAFLASPEASFITGANLYVDGGYSIV